MKRLLGHCWILKLPGWVRLHVSSNPQGVFCARTFNDIQFFFSHACLFVCLLAWLWLLRQISCAYGDGGFEDGLWQAGRSIGYLCTLMKRGQRFFSVGRLFILFTLSDESDGCISFMPLLMPVSSGL